MGKQLQKTFRGQGVSDKLTKDGKPKRAGNWSAITIHHQSLQFKDWAVRRINGELIIGDRTKLTEIFPAELVRLIDGDPNFDSLNQKGTHTYNCKQYEARRSLRRLTIKCCLYDDREYLYREEIYTDGDFNYQFREY